ncbi:MAG: hypothetical protein DRJ38_01870 [Thermoprotei archaeon]|nr:MAG: hypothetical protein DRJ38_01870 [Thermoprotei archaeon]
MRRVLRDIEESSAGRRFGALGLALALLITWITLASFVNPPPQIGGTEIRYVVNPASVDKCLKVWKFGSNIICKTQQRYVPSLGAKAWKPMTAFTPIVQYGPEPESPSINFKLHGRGSFTGSGVVVAVVDTGIDYTHPAFENAILEIWTVLYVSAESGEFLHWIVGVNGTIEDLLTLDQAIKDRYGEYAFADECGHGTHVAGIIAGRQVGDFVGFAPSAKLFIVKAFWKNGTAGTDMVLDALQIVYDNADRLGIKVVNLSWGALLNSDGSDPISVAAASLAEKGILVFAAAGNEGNLPFKILSPAVHEDVIALGAADPYTGKIAPFSSWGTTVDLRMKPDFVAAGVSILSARSSFSNLAPWEKDERLTYASGTSMSTAVASGIATQFVEYWMKTKSKESLRDAFMDFEKNVAKRYNPYYKDFISGLGIVIPP